MSSKQFSLSIVSHGHKRYVVSLLNDLAALERTDFEVVLTLNLPEELGIDCSIFPFPITLIPNHRPKRFSENHNAAFQLSSGEYFVILNPDIRIHDDPFDLLLRQMQHHRNCVCAPLIISGNGKVEDSARNFPTPLFLIRKALGMVLKRRLTSDFVPVENGLSSPDWVAGMFIVVPRKVYQRLNGLDEAFRMYYEDVDFCARARLAGYTVMVNGYVKVIHEAQRDSHRKLQYLYWHLRSALRFFTSKVFLKIQLDRLFRV